MAIDPKLYTVVSSRVLLHDTIRDVRKKVLILLNRKIRQADILDNLKLVISEYFSNVIKHSSEATEIAVLFCDEPAMLVLEDNGEAINQLLAAAPSMSALTLDNSLHESGMGLALIKELFPSYRYEAKDAEMGRSNNRLWIPLPFCLKMKVVVIDDDLAQLSLLEAYLEEDYDVITFDNPLQALEELPSIGCDLIICDIKMPEMNGLRLREKVLATSAMRLTPFIFLSGAGEDEIQRTAAHLLIDDFVQKPVNKSTLINTVCRIIKRSQDIRESHDAALDKALTHSLWNALPDKIGQYECDASYRVATRGGGDFIFVEKRNQSTLIVLGDLMGHGEQAKFFSFALSGYLHGLCLALSNSGSVSDLLSGLSSRIQCSQVLANTLVTCLVMEVFEGGRIDIASGGHPPPLLVDAQGNSRAIDVGGMLPGLSDSPDYQMISLSLQPSETLLAYTDGLIEGGLSSLAGAERQDLSKLAVLLREGHADSKKCRAGYLLQALMADFTCDLPDDVTLVSIGFDAG